MYNNSPICREFSFNKDGFKQNKLEMSTKLLGGDARFIWNQNEIYCTYKNNLKTENIVNSIKKTLKSLHGSFALGIIFKDQPDLIVGARRGSPLAVGYGPNENYLGSDSYALKAMTNKICLLYTSPSPRDS